MTRKTFTLSLVPITIGLSLGLFAAPGTSVPNSDRSTELSQTVGNEWNAFSPPPDMGTPGRREGGGTRGNCPTVDRALTALVPQTNAGATLSGRPALFFHVPATSEQLEFEFVLQDVEYNTVYTKTLTAPGQAGIVEINLKNNAAPELQVGQHYRWYFSAICNPNDRSADIHVEGWIQRIESEKTAAKIETATSESEKIEVYSEASLWYDALAAMVEQRRTNPDDVNLEAQWQQLLTAVGLNSIAQAPLVEWDSVQYLAVKKYMARQYR
ncbi:DUF928 domain-containing protein [Oscillatoriales cyanobacterium LEGE 11467]|uniref:DUF928 domain-containing protein n=1 Tax=Zarconia navalis LEGE 11467 TaxID=1828826 RepID=A0A928W1M3_9CYAN|nr:DUF928 domain-containing protein [Zarconia navalis]MBE9041615.1 DUF928 domain-containing protein [Zarconia navalis LEGE 11467]